MQKFVLSFYLKLLSEGRGEKGGGGVSVNLYVELDEETVRKWKEIKTFLGKRNDTETMRFLVEHFLNLVKRIKEHEEEESRTKVLREIELNNAFLSIDNARMNEDMIIRFQESAKKLRIVETPLSLTFEFMLEDNGTLSISFFEELKDLMKEFIRGRIS